MDYYEMYIASMEKVSALTDSNKSLEAQLSEVTRERDRLKDELEGELVCAKGTEVEIEKMAQEINDLKSTQPPKELVWITREEMRAHTVESELLTNLVTALETGKPYMKYLDEYKNLKEK